jgi:methylated-DNA-protein-cysteine methyltransferase-like protein
VPPREEPFLTGRKRKLQRSPGAGLPPRRQRDLDELPFHEAVWALVRRIPRGRATSYGAVAAFLGSPRAARGVGYALSALGSDTNVPWWRVLNRAGEVSIKGAPGLPALQRTLLEAEGVRFDARGRVDFARFGWRGPAGPQIP